MNNIPSSSARGVPSINILDADGSALFDHMDVSNFYNSVSGDANFYGYSRDLSDYLPLSSFPNLPSELEEMSELSHLNTTSQQFLTGPTVSFPHSTILQENAAAAAAASDGRLSPGSSAPSPTSSFTSSLSPSSYYDPLLSDSESPVSPLPATPDQGFCWPTQVQGLNIQSNDSLTLRPSSCMGANDSFPSPGHSVHRRTKSSPPARREPVASKAMLEANSRRRRHPAQFECQECNQTFTALFSLKRHAQSHTGERPYACSIPGCSQRFYNSSDCKRHEKSKKRHKDLQVVMQ